MFCVIRFDPDTHRHFGVNRDGSREYDLEHVDCFYWEAGAMEVAQQFGGEVVRWDELIEGQPATLQVSL